MRFQIEFFFFHSSKFLINQNFVGTCLQDDSLESKRGYIFFHQARGSFIKLLEEMICYTFLQRIKIAKLYHWNDFEKEEIFF